ncbi:hypothetical protein ACHAWF_009386, partial [Thalassiosira exigua]
YIRQRSTFDLHRVVRHPPLPRSEARGLWRPSRLLVSGSVLFCRRGRFEDAASPGSAPSSLLKLPPPHPHQYVDHTYTDYAHVKDDDLLLATDAPTPEEAKKSRRGANGVVTPFPGKLLEVLDRGDLCDMIGWMEHGRAFIVKNPRLFAERVLPRFFRQTKYLSFTRQLNLWGFKRITRGADAGAYYHELFLPGRHHLPSRMRRIKIKGAGVRTIPNPRKEPNFYRDWPFAAKVVRKGGAGPMPMLPGERIANLAGAGTGKKEAPRQEPQTAVNGGPTAAPAATGSVVGLGPGTAVETGLGAEAEANVLSQASASATSEKPTAAVAAEFRFRDSVRERSSSMIDLRAHRLSEVAVDPDAPEKAKTAPPALNVQDPISEANRRLMERLINNTTSAPVPSYMLQPRESEALLLRHRRSSIEASSYHRRPSIQTSAYLGNQFGEALALGHRHPSVQMSEYMGHRRPSIQILGHSNAAQALSPAAFAGSDLASPLRGLSHFVAGRDVGSFLASSSRARSLDMDVGAIAHSVSEAGRLEDLAQSQRENARALASELLRRHGGQQVPPELQDFLPSPP